MFEDTADSFLNISDHLIDEDDMASDSATKVPSQQSVKAYVDGKISVSGWQSVTVAVSSADILSLFTTPKEIIPAPGAGKYIQVLAGYVLLDVGTAYSDTTTQLVYGTGQVVAGTITSFLNAAVDTIFNFSASGSARVALSQYENSNIEYTALAADPTGGTGTISINIIYRTITF